MAAATLNLGSIAGTVLTLHYDDVTMQASSLTLDTSNGHVACNVTFSAQGVSSQSLTTSPGINATMNFLPAATVISRTVNGRSVLFIEGLSLTFQAVASN